MVRREHTRPVRVRDVQIGGSDRVVIQSMTTTDTRDVQGTLDQIRRLEEAGCQIVRLAVPDMRAAEALGEIRKGTDMPLVADIHFDWRLALTAIRNGVDKVRINPGNIGSADKVREVVRAAKERGIPIRIGVNSGSVERHLLEKYGYPCAEAMVESALGHVRILEEHGFYDIVISLKSTDVPTAIRAYEMMAERVEYPLHVGITEAGTVFAGSIKSAVGIGAILAKGIGDTLRVSLTGDPVEEVRVAKEILKSLEIAADSPVIVSCPTCGRCAIDLIGIANRVEREIADLKVPLKVAVMGCAVNGPGEAREADIGIAGGRGEGLLFKKGEVVRKVSEDQIVDVLLAEIREMAARKEQDRG
ncbi:flavodoxin-dependent (E)-4-hydroxy-3-methylbut-2-enyl-diphosphate synthase [Kyrpidia spormannii]|uniref:4-hydroxy-3-methylbut-2-en-1-yl diphosphate synthase (flavodoxin) n=2 Tax=Kyrpidia spormannii TaxID=2055160 RepID=A0A6F9E954_9BACL|nr:flavodoxin-dependent (E)-4-hydroxy-3-methylbut-2-enyl-diphosphate synthase [Kyrpidia spormannii]CAB3392442.1 4-hydroxy-3-methylbut-2-en-1-yl diphosphate synthase (1-hydroxy-2-methyl-2-(E)-butenyl 4-diphosphate synthase) [Kyrpidia spormannii]CAB3393368.1 4-hydroxy-3-methylbut-2-en-1-yl diphosphate synthase (1-hydroxy-2-methyl-2-(E)-butenyl 4-diphosphate synthase) [Kyrpidia spormannii]